jgi:hypothetical protein
MSMTGDYPNRSDLRNPATRQVRFTGQTYGQGVQQARSQQAVPPGTSPATVQGQQMAARQRPVPGARPLNRPTERPNEPLTAGAPFGPGPGPLEMSAPARMIPENDVLDRMLALHSMFPNDQLRLKIQQMMER